MIDLDVYVPEPLTMKVNGVTYQVKEPTTEIYLRILKLGEMQNADFEEAKEHFFSIFKETVPDLPEEIIRNMNGPQIQGYLQFLITSYLAVQNDPNFQKPMSTEKSKS